jgi:ribosomal protein S17E
MIMMMMMMMEVEEENNCARLKCTHKIQIDRLRNNEAGYLTYYVLWMQGSLFLIVGRSIR